MTAETYRAKGDTRSWGHILPLAEAWKLGGKRIIWIFCGQNVFVVKIWVKPSSGRDTYHWNTHISPYGIGTLLKKFYLTSLSLVTWIITFTQESFPLCIDFPAFFPIVYSISCLVCITHYHQLSNFKRHTFMIPLFLRVRSSCIV